jgi:hypothetical protein
VDVRHRVARDDDVEVADVRVERRVEDALLRHLADEHDPLDVLLREQVLQRRLVEDRVPRLDDEQRVVARHDRLHEAPELALEHLLDERVPIGVPGAEVVVDVDGQHVLLAGALDQARHRGQALLDRGDELLGVGVLVAVEHVDDDQGGPGHRPGRLRKGPEARLR